MDDGTSYRNFSAGDDADEPAGLAETLAAACARLTEISDAGRDPRLTALMTRMRELGAALGGDEPSATLRRS